MVIQLFDNERYQTQAKENRIRLISIKAPGEKSTPVPVISWPPISWYIPEPVFHG